MHVGKGQYQDIEIDGHVLERVSDFIYLCSNKTSNGDCKADVARRIGMAKTKRVELKNMWKDKDLSLKLKLKTSTTPSCRGPLCA